MMPTNDENFVKFGAVDAQITLWEKDHWQEKNKHVIKKNQWKHIASLADGPSRVNNVSSL